MAGLLHVNLVNLHLHGLIQNYRVMAIVPQKFVNRASYDIMEDFFPTKCTTVSQISQIFTCDFRYPTFQCCHLSECLSALNICLVKCTQVLWMSCNLNQNSLLAMIILNHIADAKLKDKTLALDRFIK